MSMGQREESLFLDPDFTYRDFLDEEGVPVHDGHAVDDVRTSMERESRVLRRNSAAMTTITFGPRDLVYLWTKITYR